MNPELTASMAQMNEQDPSLASVVQSRSFAPATPTLQERKAFLDQQYKTAMEGLQKKYAGKLSPTEMKKLHYQAIASSIAPGSSESPSYAGMMRRVAANSPRKTPPVSITQIPAMPFKPMTGGMVRYS